MGRLKQPLLRSRIKALCDTGDPPVYLEPIRTLSRRWGVSPTTLIRAVRSLKDEGVLAVTPNGKRIVSVRPSNAARDHADETATVSPSYRLPSEPSSRTHTAAARFAASVERRILEGCYRKGRELPKVGHFTLTEGVSSSTVCAGFRRLYSTGLIHKKGRSWIIGPQVHGQANSATRRIVVILSPEEKTFEWYCSFPLLGPFIDHFTDELLRNDCAHVIVVKEPGSTLFPSGMTAVKNYLKSLGDRFAGMLILAHHKGFPDIANWISNLRFFNKPIVWFDYDDQAPSVNRSTVRYARFYRLHYNERPAIEDVVHRVYALGHRRVGVADCIRYRHSPWGARRIDLIRTAAAGLRDMVLTVEPQDEPFWMEGNDNERLLYTWLHEPSQKKRRVESLERLVKGHRVTAIIAMNDLLAVNYYHWCRHAGVAVPRDLSLVSFDNLYILRHYPVSTVDFGFSTFGYLAANILLDTISVRTDRLGGVAIGERFIDRGSLVAVP